MTPDLEQKVILFLKKLINPSNWDDVHESGSWGSIDAITWNQDEHVITLAGDLLAEIEGEK